MTTRLREALAFMRTRGVRAGVGGTEPPYCTVVSISKIGVGHDVLSQGEVEKDLRAVEDVIKEQYSDLIASWAPSGLRLAAKFSDYMADHDRLDALFAVIEKAAVNREAE